MMQTMHLHDFAPPPRVLHLARTTFRGPERRPPHTHDFAELFWIEEGRAIHAVNGVERELQAGTVVLIRPQDAHTFGTLPGQTCALMNLAFAASALAHMVERYGADCPLFGQADGPMPPEGHLAPGALDGLGLSAERLLLERDSRLALDRFLLNLAHQLGQGSTPRMAEAVPGWLGAALVKLHEPQHFRQGPSHLAKLAGRSHEHVARVLKQATGQTLTEIIGQARLEHAARLLVLTEREIADIADDVGFASLGHFYACFRTAFGTTPRRYRLRQRRLL